MTSKSLSVEDVNYLSCDNFIKVFGNVVEHYPSAAIGILKNRPFESASQISDAINYFLDDLNFTEKQKILSLHPDLGGKLADLGQLSIESKNEQETVGLHCISNDIKHQLTALNTEYTNKFGFPFVICVKENTFTSILDAIKRRLNNNKNEELNAGIEEVKKISKHRIIEIIKD